MKTKLGIWQCLDRLMREGNPRLVVIVERKDARQLLATRAALKTLVTNGINKNKIATAKRLLAQK